MSAKHSNPRRRRILRALGGFLILAAAAVAFSIVQRGSASRTSSDSAVEVASDGSAQGTEAAIDSAAADSTASDSTQTKSTASKGGLFAFLRRGTENKKEDAEEEPAVPVEMSAVGRKDIPSFFTGTATVEAEQRAQVLAKIAGTVAEIHVEEGVTIRKGQVLLQIDDAEERARLQELRVRAASLQHQYERTKALLAKDLVSDRERDDQKLLAEEAQAKLLVGEIQLEHTRVKAPFDGRVTLRNIHVGEHVQVNQALFDIADFDPLLVRVFMPERQVERIAVGQSVDVFPDAGGELSYPGRVRMIAPIVDTASGTVKVTVELDGAPEGLRLGSFVRARITTDVHQDALVVPKVALIEDGGESYVFRADADSVVRVRIQTGYTDSESAEVLVGLREGDRVVTAGQGGLKHGTRVRDLNAIAGKDGGDASKGDKNDDDVAKR